MDYAEHEFLTAVFLTLVNLEGDPRLHVDRVIGDATTERVHRLTRAARRHRERIVEMVEEHRRTGRRVTAPWWRL